MQKKYSRPGELIEMRLNNKQDIKIVGFKCNEVKIETSKIIDKAKTYNFPDTWENIIELLVSDQQCFLKDIQQGSNEWERIVANFMLTIPQSKILKIQRVQNKKLWRVFQNEVDDVCTKINKQQKDIVAEMYHGTSGTPPQIIYQSEEGFDMTYSRQGMWGHANYFAKNSSYSNSYAYQVPDGTRQMFVANVIVGIPAILPSD